MRFNVNYVRNVMNSQKEMYKHVLQKLRKSGKLNLPQTQELVEAALAKENLPQDLTITRSENE